MLIALVSDWFLPRRGGIELHLRDLAQRLTSRGHEVRIVTPFPGEPVVEGVEVARVAAARLPWAGTLWTPDGVRAIGRALDALRPDVVHAHVSIVSPAAYAGAAWGARHGVPTVLTFHSVIAGLGPIFGALDALLGASRWPAVFTAVSGKVADPVRSLTGGREVIVLPNGVDPAAWAVEPAPRAPGRLELVSVMRLNAKKRPTALVRLLHAVRSRLPAGMTPRLRIAGDGPERRAVERLVRRLALDDQVELLGWQPRERIRALLAEADLFVLPSTYESFGLAALEARCAGVPVLAMARSGVREVIDHGREGLLAGSDAELAAHVVRLAHDAPLRAAIAAHNRATRPAASWERIVDRHLELYGEAARLVGRSLPA